MKVLPGRPTSGDMWPVLARQLLELDPSTRGERLLHGSFCRAVVARRRMNNELNFPPNFERLVLGCINADFCK